jgi:hypothetical protein
MEGDWRSTSKGQINLAGSFSQFLGWIMRIHTRPCENVMVGLKKLMTRSFTWSWSVPWLAKKSRMLPCADISVGLEGSDDAILHMCCYESGRRAKMTWLAQKNSLGGSRRRCNVDERTNALSWVNSLIPWPSGWTNSLRKNPLFRDKTQNNG